MWRACGQVDQLAGRQRGHQRRMPRTDAETALYAGQPDLVGLDREDALLRRDDFQRKSHQRAICRDFSTASSMFPTM